MAKKKKQGGDESENIQLRPNEKILKTARPGRAAELYFIVPALAFFGVGIALMTHPDDFFICKSRIA